MRSLLRSGRADTPRCPKDAVRRNPWEPRLPPRDRRPPPPPAFLADGVPMPFASLLRWPLETTNQAVACPAPMAHPRSRECSAQKVSSSLLAQAHEKIRGFCAKASQAFGAEDGSGPGAMVSSSTNALAMRSYSTAMLKMIFLELLSTMSSAIV